MKEDINRKRFNNEIKMFVNKRLFEKKIITEDMFLYAKERLIKETGN